MNFPRKEFENWFSAHEAEVQSDFFRFLSFRSISTDESYRKECLDTADWLKRCFESSGWSCDLLQSSGLPVVLAEWKKDPTFPTVLLYHHYDVQPVDPIDLWSVDPFTPTIQDGKVFARGASDNKGQCFLTMTALKAVAHLYKDLPLNIKVFIEGEEESGGGGTQEVLKKHQDRLKADYLCVIDFDIPSLDVPAVAIGYRGILALHVSLKNASTDMHSGVHGGIALNPNRILVDLLSKFWNEKGKVTVPHFYDDVVVLGHEEKNRIDFSFDEDLYRKNFGVGALCKEEGVTPKEANGLCPTLEINGMWGGYTGPGFKTVIPKESYAKISCRLVPDQDPDKIAQEIERFLLQNTPKGAEVKVSWHHGAKAYRMSPSSPLIQTVQKSMEDIFQKSCVFTLCGGAVPIVRDLVQASQAEPALFGFALDTDNVHAPNEHFHWEGFRKGFMTIARILWEISCLKKIQ